jgi:hypothetical protein
VPLAGSVSSIFLGQPGETWFSTSDIGGAGRSGRPYRMQHCPNCGGGELKIIAATLERPVVQQILTHLGLGF